MRYFRKLSISITKEEWNVLIAQICKGKRDRYHSIENK